LTRQVSKVSWLHREDKDNNNLTISSVINDAYALFRKWQRP